MAGDTSENLLTAFKNEDNYGLWEGGHQIATFVHINTTGFTYFVEDTSELYKFFLSCLLDNQNRISRDLCEYP